MSYEFIFASVPLDRDGTLSDLPVTATGDIDVPVLECTDVSFNLPAMDRVRALTPALGPLLGAGNLSVNKLSPRRTLIARLHRDAARCDDVVLRTKLELMAANCEAAIAEFGERAAVVVL